MLVVTGFPRHQMLGFTGLDIAGGSSPPAPQTIVARRPSTRSGRQRLIFAGGLALGGDALTVEDTINYANSATGDAIIVRARAIVSMRRRTVCQYLIYMLDSDIETTFTTGFDMAAAAAEKSSLGTVWHAPSPPPVTMRTVAHD